MSGEKENFLRIKRIIQAVIMTCLLKKARQEVVKKFI